MSASTVQAPPQRGGALDLIRFAAAAFVVIYHMGPIAPTPLAELHPVFGRGYLATDLFLMLSGYVLARIYGRLAADGRLQPLAFLRKRLLRIWPSHGVVLLGFAALIVAAGAMGVQPDHPERFGWSALALQLGLAQAWGLPNAAGWNMPTWTLSALAPCYALFVWLWRRLERLGVWMGLIGAFVALGLTDGLCLLLLGDTVDHLPHWLGVVRAMPLFLIGLALAKAGASLSGEAKTRTALAVAGAALLVLAQAWRPVDLVAVAALGMVIIGSDSRSPGGSATVARLAALSFPLFLVHTPTLAVWTTLAERLAPADAPAALRWLAWGFGFAASVGVAALFDRWVDRPLSQLTRLELRFRRPAGRTYPAE